MREPAVTTVIERHCIRAVLLRELIPDEFGNPPHDAVDESSAFGLPTSRDHRLVDRGVLRDLCQEHKLKDAEVENVPDARLDRVQGDLDKGLQNRIERAASANHAEDELRLEATVQAERFAVARASSMSRRRRHRASGIDAAHRRRLAEQSS